MSYFDIRTESKNPILLFENLYRILNVKIAFFDLVRMILNIKIAFLDSVRMLK